MLEHGTIVHNSIEQREKAKKASQSLEVNFIKN